MVVKQASESRMLGISLQQVQYSDQLSEQLLRHGKDLEQLYSAMQTLVNKTDTSDRKFQKAIDLAKTKMAWFEKSKAWSN